MADAARGAARHLKSHTIAGQQFFLPAEIEPKSIIGKGSYGVVVSALDNCTNCKVAIKRIKPYAGDDWEARHTLREIQLMRLLGFHPNIVSLNDLWAREEDNELYLTMELMDSDLHQIIQSKQNLSEPHHQCLMKQLLLGVQAMHKCGVLHRDLKPGNLLVTRDCQLRITDFGLARAWTAQTPERSDTEVGLMTEYVVTRWYRCPELLLAPHLPYHGAIDLWSVGCIFGELVTRRPLFPGKSYVHQVQVILDKLGTPAASDYGFVPRDDAASFLKRQQHRQGLSWTQILPKASEEAKDFLRRLLIWDPNKRMTVDEALAHPWLQQAPPIPVSIVPLKDLLDHKRQQNITFAFEDTSTSLPSLKSQIEQEVELVQERRTEMARAPTGAEMAGTAAAAAAAAAVATAAEVAAPPSTRVPESNGTFTPNSAARTATPSSTSSNGSRTTRPGVAAPREVPGNAPRRNGASRPVQHHPHPVSGSAGSGASRKTAHRKATGSSLSSSASAEVVPSTSSSSSSSQIDSLRRRIDQMNVSARPHQRASLPSIRGGVLSRVSKAAGGNTLASTSARGRMNDRLDNAIRYGHGVSSVANADPALTAARAATSGHDRQRLVRGSVRDLRQQQQQQQQQKPTGTSRSPPAPAQQEQQHLSIASNSSFTATAPTSHPYSSPHYPPTLARSQPAPPSSPRSRMRRRLRRAVVTLNSLDTSGLRPLDVAVKWLALILAQMGGLTDLSDKLREDLKIEQGNNVHEELMFQALRLKFSQTVQICRGLQDQASTYASSSASSSSSSFAPYRSSASSSPSAVTSAASFSTASMSLQGPVGPTMGHPQRQPIMTPQREPSSAAEEPSPITDGSAATSVPRASSTPSSRRSMPGSVPLLTALSRLQLTLDGALEVWAKKSKEEDPAAIVGAERTKSSSPPSNVIAGNASFGPSKAPMRRPSARQSLPPPATRASLSSRPTTSRDGKSTAVQRSTVHAYSSRRPSDSNVTKRSSSLTRHGTSGSFSSSSKGPSSQPGDERQRLVLFRDMFQLRVELRHFSEEIKSFSDVSNLRTTLDQETRKNLQLSEELDAIKGRLALDAQGTGQQVDASKLRSLLADVKCLENSKMQVEDMCRDLEKQLTQSTKWEKILERKYSTLKERSEEFLKHAQAQKTLLEKANERIRAQANHIELLRSSARGRDIRGSAL